MCAEWRSGLNSDPSPDNNVARHRLAFYAAQSHRALFFHGLEAPACYRPRRWSDDHRQAIPYPGFLTRVRARSSKFLCHPQRIACTDSLEGGSGILLLSPWADIGRERRPATIEVALNQPGDAGTWVRMLTLLLAKRERMRPTGLPRGAGISR